MIDAESEAGYAEGFREAYDAAFQTALDEAYHASRLAFRARCREIMCSSEAKGREAVAQHLALETDLTAEQAIGLLAKSLRTSSIGERQRDTIVKH